LAAAGASLAAVFLEAGMAAGDSVVLRRLIGLLVEPLASWDSGTEVQPNLLDVSGENAIYVGGLMGSFPVTSDRQLGSIPLESERGVLWAF
jgi:hypothetical protein